MYLIVVFVQTRSSISCRDPSTVSVCGMRSSADYELSEKETWEWQYRWKICHGRERV